jgi:hypothetical protein
VYAIKNFVTVKDIIHTATSGLQVAPFVTTNIIHINFFTLEKTEASNEMKFARSTVETDWIDAETDTDVVVLSFVFAGGRKLICISTVSLVATVAVVGKCEATKDLSSDT